MSFAPLPTTTPLFTPPGTPTQPPLPTTPAQQAGKAAQGRPEPLAGDVRATRRLHRPSTFRHGAKIRAISTNSNLKVVEKHLLLR
ncbi:hypothetical protein V3C41_20870 [Paenarthrobacter nicotinovorans]|uniref:Uncharacterized protein n=1 Tax=Paenarthrobacter nicotinovorans TaxID=29320 RepID=A0ABV0GYK6_PAENI